MLVGAPDIQEAVRATVREELRRVWTGGPARVIAVNASAGTVDARPLVRRPLPRPLSPEVDYAADEPLRDVPVVDVGSDSAGGANFAMSVGDVVWLLPATNSLVEWLGAPAQTAEPDEPGYHDLGFAVALPLRRPGTVGPARRAAGATVINGGDVRLGNAATATPVARAPQTTSNFSSLAVEFNKVVAAWNTAAGGGGPLIVPAGAPLVPFAPAAVATTNTKAS